MDSKYIEKIKTIIDKPWIIFLVIGFIFGSIFLFKTPPLEVPDEPAHLLRACEVADGIIYNREPAKETQYDKLFKFKYDIENRDIKYINPNYVFKRDTNEFHYGSRNSAFMYLASSLGLKLGKLLSNDGTFIFYLGRFFNLITYLLLCTFAIRITPVFKYPFMFTALLPMALFEGMSYSADSFNNCFALLFFAFVFKLIYKNEEVTKKDFSILSFLCAIGAFCKGLIYPLCLFFVLPPFSKKFKFNKWVYIFSLIISTLILCQIWIAINAKNLNFQHEVINDSLYFIKEPLIVVCKIVLTSINNLWAYAREFIGVMGWLHIFLYPATYISALLVFSSMFVFLQEEITKKQRIFAILGFIAFYSLIQYMHLIYWSNPNSIFIQGFQGRYLISLVPLLFVVFSNSKWKFNEKFVTGYKIFLILFIIYLLISSCSAINLFFDEYNLNRFTMDNYFRNNL